MHILECAKSLIWPTMTNCWPQSDPGKFTNSKTERTRNWYECTSNVFIASTCCVCQNYVEFRSCINWWACDHEFITDLKLSSPANKYMYNILIRNVVYQKPLSSEDVKLYVHFIFNIFILTLLGRVTSPVLKKKKWKLRGSSEDSINV